MSEIPNWPTLIAREPGLAPVGSDPNHPHLVRDGDGGWCWSDRPDRVKNSTGDLSDADAGARFAMAAVLFLAKYELAIEPPGGAEHCWCVVLDYDGFYGATLDGALYAACEAVLDARDAAKGNP